MYKGIGVEKKLKKLKLLKLSVQMPTQKGHNSYRTEIIQRQNYHYLPSLNNASLLT